MLLRNVNPRTRASLRITEKTSHSCTLLVPSEIVNEKPVVNPLTSAILPGAGDAATGNALHIVGWYVLASHSRFTAIMVERLKTGPSQVDTSTDKWQPSPIYSGNSGFPSLMKRTCWRGEVPNIKVGELIAPMSILA